MLAVHRRAKGRRLSDAEWGRRRRRPSGFHRAGTARRSGGLGCVAIRRGLSAAVSDHVDVVAVMPSQDGATVCNSHDRWRVYGGMPPRRGQIGPDAGGDRPAGHRKPDVPGGKSPDRRGNGEPDRDRLRREVRTAAIAAAGFDNYLEGAADLRGNGDGNAADEPASSPDSPPRCPAETLGRRISRPSSLRVEAGRSREVEAAGEVVAPERRARAAEAERLVQQARAPMTAK